MKDLSTYKRLADTIQKKITFDTHQKKIIRRHEDELKGIKKSRPRGIQGYFDVRNGVGHSVLTAVSADECLSILIKYPDMPECFDVECTNEETVLFLKSCTGCFEAVQAYVESRHADQLQAQLDYKQTNADKDSELEDSAVVYPYKKAVPKNIVENLPPGFCVAKSDSGWMTSEIFFEFMANTFIPQLAEDCRQQKGLQPEEDLILTEDDWVVYWVDGYKSHLRLHTSKLC